MPEPTVAYVRSRTAQRPLWPAVTFPRPGLAEESESESESERESERKSERESKGESESESESERESESESESEKQSKYESESASVGVARAGSTTPLPKQGSSSLFEVESTTPVTHAPVPPDSPPRPPP